LGSANEPTRKRLQEKGKRSQYFSPLYTHRSPDSVTLTGKTGSPAQTLLYKTKASLSVEQQILLLKGTKEGMLQLGKKMKKKLLPLGEGQKIVLGPGYYPNTIKGLLPPGGVGNTLPHKLCQT
jgi:hypothetical protein